MKQYLDLINKVKLFHNIKDEEILSALGCLNARIKAFDKNSFIYTEGESAKYMGILLEGEAEIQKTDYNGNINIISKLYPSDLIAASACYSSLGVLPFDIKCICEVKVLCLNIANIIRPCCNACSFHAQLIKNMLGMIADKNMQLTYKIDILTKRTIREKLLAYLSSQSKRARSTKFSVPLSRRQMADFLSINRSALSRELCSLRDEGLLEFDNNSFVLKI